MGDAENVLQLLSNVTEITSLQIAEKLNIDHQKAVGFIKSLQSLGDVSKILQLLKNSCIMYVYLISDLIC